VQSFNEYLEYRKKKLRQESVFLSDEEEGDAGGRQRKKKERPQQGAKKPKPKPRQGEVRGAWHQKWTSLQGGLCLHAMCRYECPLFRPHPAGCGARWLGWQEDEEVILEFAKESMWQKFRRRR
jgi:hypothetical protein